MKIEDGLKCSVLGAVTRDIGRKSSTPVNLEANYIKFTTETIGWTFGDVCNLSLWATAGKCFYVDWGDGIVCKYEVGEDGWKSLQYCYELTTDYKKYPVKTAEYEVIIFTEDADCVFTALDVSHFDMAFPKVDVSHCPSLVGLNCSGNELTTLDLSNNLVLTWLNCSGNQLSALDLSKNTALTTLDCCRNQLTTLDLSKNTGLTKLECSCNQLTALDLSKNTGLTEMDCGGNQLTVLDLSKNTGLTDLDCSSNLLTALDLSKNTGLTVLECNDNQLTVLDISHNTGLTELKCCNNQLTVISTNTGLTDLNCGSNQLTALDLSKNTELTHLDCSGNQLTALDLSKNTALTRLDCGGNQLTALDVHKNTALTSLLCRENQLATLDVHKNKKLDYVRCDDKTIKSHSYKPFIVRVLCWLKMLLKMLLVTYKKRIRQFATRPRQIETNSFTFTWECAPKRTSRNARSPLVGIARENSMDEQCKTFDEIMSLVEVYNEAQSELPYHINLVDLLHANENAHSRILEKLLCYRNAEKQFTILNSFFQLCDFKLSIDNPKISSGTQYIDILIQDKNYAVIIENKIKYRWNIHDEPNQIANYIEKLQKTYSNDQIYVLYLPHDNASQTPQEESWQNKNGKSYKDDFKNRFRVIAYREKILPLLKKMKIEDKEISLCCALQQYIDHLETMFNLNSYSQIKTTIMNEKMNAYIEANLKTKDVQLEKKLEAVQEKKKELQDVQNALSALERDYQANFFEEWNKRIVVDFGDDMRMDEGKKYAGVVIPINDNIRFQAYLVCDGGIFCQVENVAGNKIVPDEVKAILSSELQVWHDGQVVKETSYEEGYILLTNVIKILLELKDKMR
jgi:hypothetical protein